MATYQVNQNINASVVLSGSVATDNQFAAQPIIADQIIYPNNLTVDAQLNISGPSGTHKLWHVKQTGETVATNYVVTPGDVAVGSASYTLATAYTAATLQTGFDAYMFEGWSPQPVVGEQLITETQYGYFDNLGNYYSNVENIHDAWFVALDGTTTHFTIDNRLSGVSSNITPTQFTFVDKTDQPFSTVVESAPIDILGMDANLDSPLTVTGGEWSKSTDNGATWSTFTSAPGTVRNGNKVKLRHTTSAVGLTQTNTTLDVNGVSDVFTTTTAADLVPNVFVLGSKIEVALSTEVESTPVQIQGMTAGQNASINVVGGSYAISTDGGATYGAYTAAAGVIQNGQWVKVKHTSSASNSDTTVTTLTITSVSSSFVSTTVSAEVIVTGESGTVITPASRTVTIGANTPPQDKVWMPMDLTEVLDYAWDLTDWLYGDTIAAVVVVEGAEIVDQVIFSNTAFLTWIDPDQPGSTAIIGTAIRVTARVTTTAGRVVDLSARYSFLDK